MSPVDTVGPSGCNSTLFYISSNRSMNLCEDVSGGLENMPVSFINEVDEETLPYFEYTSKNIPGQGACEDDFRNVFLPCECTLCDSSCPCVRRSGQPYDETGSVRPTLTFPVVECSPLCCCPPETCINRVVQRGIRLNLEIFKTKEGKGFGVRTLNMVRKGAYVCSYAGEVIGLDEAQRRVATLSERDPSYVIVVREAGTETTMVDPSMVGGVGRFLNHSCSPNLAMVPVRTESVVPELALFALRDILQGEELCYDYSGGCPEVYSGEGKKSCSCGALNCRRWLPFDKNILGV